jgi:N-acyl-D-amino-acid deacylase
MAPDRTWQRPVCLRSRRAFATGANRGPYSVDSSTVSVMRTISPTLPSRARVALAGLCLAVSAGCAPKRVTTGNQAGPSGGDEPYDVLISGGKVVDGTGDAWFYGDVGVRGERIARIAPAGLLRDHPAARRIDAAGSVVAPGFIDIQAQSIDQLTAGDSRVVSMITQGVTTMIFGEGNTPAPSNDKVIAMYGATDSAQVRRFRAFSGSRGFGNWLRTMEQHGGSVNFGSFVGAATVRAYAKGEAEGRANAAEVDTMRRVVRDAMLDGAFGVASALIYPPGSYASTEELVEEAKAMAPFGGVYITHMRSEGDLFLEAIDEAFRIGREGGVPVEIYHLKAAGVRNWPKAAKALAKIDSARAAGRDVGADQYPYTAGGNNLSSCIPPWAHADGKLLERLKDPTLRRRIVTEIMDEQATSWENLCLRATPANVMVVGFAVDSLKRYEGMRLSQIAIARNEPWPDAIVDLTIAEKNALGQLIFIASDDNVAMQIRQPWMKFGTDADGVDPDSAKGVMVHPRTYGTYPRILGKYVREEHVLTLEDAIRKMTSAVANRLSIRDRGQLREGMYADITIFDPTTISDRATYERPHQISVGVRHVLVNGVEVAHDGVATGAKPGHVVRGPGWRGT